MNLYGAYVLHIKPRLSRPVHGRVVRIWSYLKSAYYSESGALRAIRQLCTHAVHDVRKSYFLWRITPAATRCLGPLWQRSRELVEIDITYTCNLKCFNCNRSCEQDPSSDRMSPAQVQRFLDESAARGVRWKRVRLLGGEPTTHPEFLQIVDLVLSFCRQYSPRTLVEVSTNGHGAHVEAALAKLPPEVRVLNTFKTSHVQTEFDTFNVAPIDVPEYAHAEFANGCGVAQMCGLGVTPYGYYPCAVAGAIDRTFGLNLGRKTLPPPDDDMRDELREFCSRCGLFKMTQREALNGPVMSPLWQAAYERSLKLPAQLSRLPGSHHLVQIDASPTPHLAAADVREEHSWKGN